jgi:hypothetical protein
MPTKTSSKEMTRPNREYERHPDVLEYRSQPPYMDWKTEAKLLELAPAWHPLRGPPPVVLRSAPHPNSRLFCFSET